MIQNQSTIHKDSDWTSQRAKEFYLNFRASGRMRLKKCVWRNESEDRAPEDTSSEARSSEAMVVAPFFGDQGYLISVWLTILFHDWTFNFKRKGEKSSKHPFEKI